MDRRKIIGLSLTLLGIVLTACGTLVGTPEPTEAVTALPEGVENAVKEAVSAKADVPVGEIDVVEAEQRDWPDACLGLAEEGEVCAQVITPGWKVTVEADGQAYVLHTNEDGTAVRVEE